MLLDTQAEIAEAKALRNLRLQQGRLRRHYAKDEEELRELQKQRFREEWEQEEKEQERRQAARRQERASNQVKRRKARAAAAHPSGETVLLDTNGFEFSIDIDTDPTPLAIHNKNGD